MVQLLAGIISLRRVLEANPGRSHGSVDTLPLRHSANNIDAVQLNSYDIWLSLLFCKANCNAWPSFNIPHSITLCGGYVNSCLYERGVCIKVIALAQFCWHHLISVENCPEIKKKKKIPVYNGTYAIHVYVIHVTLIINNCVWYRASICLQLKYISEAEL